MSKRPPVRGDLKGLWSIAWRTFLLGPIMVPIGWALLTVAIASVIVPPLYAIICLFFTGEYLRGVGVAVVWAVWLRFGGALLKPVFENWRDDGG